MADFTGIRKKIDSDITENGRGLITGGKAQYGLNGVLQEIVTVVSEVDSEGKVRDETRGEQIKAIQDMLSDAAHYFDASELLTAIRGGSLVSEEFVANIKKAVAEKKYMFIADGATVYTLCSGGTVNGDMKFTSIGGRTMYSITMKSDRSVSLDTNNIGTEVSVYNNTEGKSIMNLSTESKTEEIQEVFTNAWGEVAIPETGDIFNVYQNSDIATSGVVLSKVEDVEVRMSILVNNFEDSLFHIRFLKLRYSSGNLGTLKVLSVIETVVDFSLLGHEKMALLIEQVNGNKNKIAEQGNTITEHGQTIATHTQDIAGLKEADGSIERGVAENASSIESEACHEDKGGLHTAISYSAEREICICGYPLVVRGNGAPSQENMSDERMKPLAGAPAFVGQLYIDTSVSNGGLYYAVGTASVSDWKNA